MRFAVALCATLLLGAAPQAKLPPRLNAYLLKHSDYAPNTRFAVAWVDLNGDGRREAIVYMLGQCGSGGCPMVVLTPQGNNYRKVSYFTIVQLPVRVLPGIHHGWRDIGVGVHGGGIMRPYIAALRFDGRRYPFNPTVPPAVRVSRPAGTIVIEVDDEGLPLSR